MKKLIAIAGLALLTSTAWAHHEHFGNNGEMYGSPLVEHGPGETVHAVQLGEGDAYASPHIEQPADHTHDKGEGGQKGEGDLYGSILVDIGAL